MWARCPHTLPLEGQAGLPLVCRCRGASGQGWLEQPSTLGDSLQPKGACHHISQQISLSFMFY